MTRAALSEWNLRALEETVALLVTELISNGVRHAGTTLELLLDYEGTCLRVSVTDRAPSLSVSKGRRARAEFGGWGLDLVDALSARWSVDVDGSGTKAVWFEIDTPGLPPTPDKGLGTRERSAPARVAAERDGTPSAKPTPHQVPPALSSSGRLSGVAQPS